VLDQTQHIAGIAVLVVVPGNNLDEGAIQRNAGAGINAGASDLVWTIAALGAALLGAVVVVRFARG